jgi:hypothetical protein
VNDTSGEVGMNAYLVLPPCSSWRLGQVSTLYEYDVRMFRIHLLSYAPLLLSSPFNKKDSRMSWQVSRPGFPESLHKCSPNVMDG